MRQQDFVELEKTQPEIDDEESLYVKSALQRTGNPNQSQLKDMVDQGIYYYQKLRGVLYWRSDRLIDLEEDITLITCDRIETGFVATVQQNVLRVYHNLSSDAFLNSSSIHHIVLNKHQSHGKIVDMAWSYDQQSSLLFSTTTGLFYSTFPSVSEKLSTEHHHIIDTRMIAYPSGISYVMQLSPSPLGRYVLCLGVAHDQQTKYLLLGDTAFHSWEYISLSRNMLDSIWKLPQFVLDLWEGSYVGMESLIIKFKWIDAGERIALTLKSPTLSESILILETYQWNRQSVVIPNGLVPKVDNSMFVTYSWTVLSNKTLVAYPITQAEYFLNEDAEFCPLEITAACMEPLLYLDGTSISSIRSAKPSLKIAHPQLHQSSNLRMSIKSVKSSSCGGYLAVSYQLFQRANETEKFSVSNYPCVDIFSVLVEDAAGRSQAADNVTMQYRWYVSVIYNSVFYMLTLFNQN
jgi:hypothetical protein